MKAGLNPYVEFKQSGIRWLGTIPRHWELKRPKQLFRKMARPVRDCDEVVTCFRDGLVTLRKNRRLLGFTESLKEIGYQGVRRGDLVIHGMDAFAGSIGVSDSDGKATPVYSVCAPLGTHVNPHYYSYCVREMARAGWIAALAKGIRERSTDFRFDVFGVQGVPFPPPSEQTAIARFLDHMDRRIQTYIRAKEKLIALLDEYKQALIHQAVTGQIDVRTGEPYPEYKESGIGWLGHVPANWSVGPLKRFAIKRRGAIKAGPFGSQLTADEMMGTDVKVYTQRNVIDRNLAEGSNYVSNEKFEALRPFQVWPGDVLVTSRGTIGRTMLVTDDCERGILHPCLIRVQPDRKHLVAAFIMAVIQDSQLLPKQLMFLSNATTIHVIYSVTLANVVVPVPPLSEQTAIVHFLRNATAKVSGAVAHVRREIETLTEYRTRLIADAVTGKLDVREAAAALPDPDPENAGTSGNNSLALDEATAVA